ncbi:uncharacterized protein LOC108197737 isoform X2 [Daucus carota subsp. sativus]|uniref:uncharacterized protein LOC108197737 isoform X2 n=1 Tax=Daucus carota subsp. sativus TaxID=79200 RepID=UPI0030833D5A
MCSVFPFLSGVAPYQIYKEKVDISRVPRIFLEYDDGLGEEGEEEDGVYLFPGNDVELLDMTPRPMMLPRVVGISKPSEIYLVDVKADSCTVEECLELLKRIGCDNKFITNSVESARLFYAELNEDEAVKLKGLNEIDEVYRRRDLLFDL